MLDKKLSFKEFDGPISIEQWRAQATKELKKEFSEQHYTKVIDQLSYAPLKTEENSSNHWMRFKLISILILFKVTQFYIISYLLYILCYVNNMPCNSKVVTQWPHLQCTWSHHQFTLLIWNSKLRHKNFLRSIAKKEKKRFYRHHRSKVDNLLKIAVCVVLLL